jgi:type I restriction enzyme, S subunit
MADEPNGGERYTLRLGDLGRIVTGKTPSTKVAGHFGGDIPFITPSDMDGRKTIALTHRYLTEDGANAVRNAEIPAGTVMVSCIGSDLGKTAIAGRRSFTNQQLNSIIVDDRCDAEYVYYNLSARQDELKHQGAGGSAVPILNKGHFSEVSIDLPPLPEQRAIASILGALDDKIELNRRMNASLESLARAIFKSWFVDFDPVRMKSEGRPVTSENSAAAPSPVTLPPAIQDLFPSTFHDSELGDIPEGWSVRTVADVTHRVTKGDTPRKAAMTAAADDNMVNMLRVNAITEGGEILKEKLLEIPESIHLGKSKRSILKRNFILYTNAGTIGRVALVQEDILPANTNQAIAIVQPDESKVPSTFLFMVLRQEAFQAELHCDIVQAVQANLALGKIAEAQFVMPPGDVLPKLIEPISELLDQIWANRKQSSTLSTLRDTLLPKLLSGELPVPAALTATEEAFA